MVKKNEKKKTPMNLRPNLKLKAGKKIKLSNNQNIKDNDQEE